MQVFPLSLVIHASMDDLAFECPDLDSFDHDNSFDDIRVDFSTVDSNNSFINYNQSFATTSKYNTDYNKFMRENVRVMRSLHLDPFTAHEVPDQLVFQFSKMWDPYTGIRTNDDPYGALWFNVATLTYHFWLNRYTHLWVRESDEHDGYYEGYYDDGVGAGDQFYITGRGEHPEWYLFRLPLPNYYLTDDHNEQIITMGPRLTDSEIININTKLHSKHGINIYNRLFYRNPPNLVQLKQLYDMAISKTPNLTIFGNVLSCDNPSPEQINDAYNIINRIAVDKIKNM